MIRKQLKSLAAVFVLATTVAPASTVALSGPQPSLIDLAVELNAPGSSVAASFDTLLAAVLVANPQVLKKLPTTVSAPCSRPPMMRSQCSVWMRAQSAHRTRTC